MSLRRVLRLSGVMALALGATVVVAAAGLPASAPLLGGSTARLGSTAQSGAGDCFAFNSAASALTYGGDYPGTKKPFDYGQASQFATTMNCGGPFGPNSTYCDTLLSPKPQVG